MVSPIFSDGTEYISASRASQKLGYASDYIGQLCRAKKIPGKLIGRTWYVDFTSLLEHKKNRKYKKKTEKREIPVQDLSIKNFSLSYSKEKLPLFPKLTKNKRDDQKRKVRTTHVPREILALMIFLIMTVGTGLFLFKHTSPSVVINTHENIANTFRLVNPQLAAISLFDNAGEFLENIHISFRTLKDIALNKFFYRLTPFEITKTSTTTIAVTEPVRPLNLISLKNELKTELESYIRIQINALRPPIVVYSSSPSLALADLESFRVNEVAPEIHYRVTNQSTSDVELMSSQIGRLTDGGTFVNATIGGNSSFAGSSVSTDFLSFVNATGTSATTTNLFVSGLASTTNFRANVASVGNLTSSALTVSGLGGLGIKCVQTDNNGLLSFAASACGVSGGGGTWATTTSQVANQFINYPLDTNDIVAIGNFSTTTAPIYFDPNTSFTKIFNQYFGTSSTTLQNLTFINATGTSATTTNLYVSGLSSTTELRANTGYFGGRVGIGTMNPLTQLHVYQPTAATPALIVDGANNYAGLSLYYQGTEISRLQQEGTGNLYIDTDNDLFLRPGNVASTIFKSSGNVGIGTTSPLTKFSVAGNTYLGGWLMATGTISALGDFIVNGSSTLQNFTATNSTTTSATSSNLYVSGLASSTNLRANLGYFGNVGIGIAAPTSNLHIKSTTAGAGAGAIFENDGTATGNLTLTLRRNTSDESVITHTPGGSGLSLSTNHTDGAIRFLTNTTLTEAARITNNGFIGIGTTTPFSILQIATTSISSTFKSQLTLTDIDGGTNAKHWNFTSVGGQLRIGTSSDQYATSTYLTIANGGNVGIGTNEPWGVLTVRTIPTSIPEASLTRHSPSIASFSAANPGVELGIFAINTDPYGISLQTRLDDGSNASFPLALNPLGGNVGIGTTSPYAKFSIHAIGVNSFQPLFIIASSTSAFATTTHFIVTNTGNIGMGTTSPFAKLSIEGAAGATTNLFAISTTTSGFATTTALIVDQNGNLSLLNGGNLTSSGLGTFTNILANASSTLQNFTATNSTTTNATTTAFYVSGLASTTELRANTAYFGSIVGIGTTTPIDRLNILADNNPVGLGEFGGANLLYNGGAEDGTNGWTSRDFGIDGSSGSGTTESHFSFSGANNFSTLNDGGMNQEVIVLTGSTYTYSARVRVHVINAGGDASQGQIVVGTTATGRDIVDKSCNPNTYDVTPNLYKWTLCSVTFTAPTVADVATTTIYVGFRANSTTHTVDFDNLSLVRGGLIASYSPLTTFVGSSSATVLTGHVGIGTTTPGLTLNVYGGSTYNGLTSNLLLEHTLPGIQFWDTNDGASAAINSNSGVLNFYTNAAGAFVAADLKMVIDTSGNVGIGTTTPTWLLNPYSATTPQLALSNGAGVAQWAFRNAGGNLYFATTTVAGNATSSPSALSIIGSSGNVGIGTTAPSTLLHVYSPADNQARIALNSGSTAAGGYAGLEFRASTNAWGGGIFKEQSTHDISIWTQASNAAPRLVILNSGNVGIGTTDPQSQFSVTGTVRLQGIGTGAGSGTICYTSPTGVLSTSTSGCTGSSLRIKDNIENLSYGLEDVMKIRAVSFDYKPEMYVPGHQVGFIAEELVNIVPEAVGFDKDGLPYNIDYGKLTPILIRAVQELYAKFTALSDTVLAILNRLAGHDEKIAALEARVAQLEAMVNNGGSGGGGTVSVSIPDPVSSTTPSTITPEPTSTTTPTVTEPVSETVPIAESIPDTALESSSDLEPVPIPESIPESASEPVPNPEQP